MLSFTLLEPRPESSCVSDVLDQKVTPQRFPIKPPTFKIPFEYRVWFIVLLYFSKLLFMFLAILFSTSFTLKH